MLKTDPINEIHRLAGGEHWSIRRIVRQLHMDTRTVKKYLDSPVPAPIRRPRPSKLDPFKPLIVNVNLKFPKWGIRLTQVTPTYCDFGFWAPR
jgi:transposase